MSKAISVIWTVPRAYAAQVPLPAKAKTKGMVRTGEVTGAIAATDWANVSQGVRMLWRRPYSISEPVARTAVVSGGSGASPENWFKKAEFASDEEGKGLKLVCWEVVGEVKGFIDGVE